MNRLKIILCAILTIAALNTFAQSARVFGLNNIPKKKSIGSNALGSSKCRGGDDIPPKDDPSYPDDYPSDSTDIPVFFPKDPNEIVGTRGYDALGDTLQWVAATASLPYTIYFENDPELATAAAQKVEIRHALHPKADITTFAVGAFGFGSHVFTMEGNYSTYQQRLDLIADMGIYVDVVAGIDIIAGEVFWIFQSIDPATGLPPQGAQQGFLPVNDENHSGEGYVSFTIKPKANVCVTGDELTADASIVFDINEAIPTNVWHNTVDALPPTTQLTGTESNDNEVLLQFSGEDDLGGCGIKQYKLYVSDNYGAYSLYDTYPAGSEATFPTEYDHCYRFFCLGEDNVGNVEEMKEEAEYEFGNYNLMVSVSAFPEEGGTVSGGGWYAYNSQVTVSAMAASGYEFYRWTHNGVPVSEESTYTFTITEEMDLVAQFVEMPPVTQQYELAQGWTWWSTYIEQNGINGLQMLENSLGGSGVQIKSQEDFVNYYEGMGWIGMLENIDNESSYMIKTSAACVVEMVGEEATPSAHPITIGSGWNWIGYPVSTSMSVATVFSCITPTEGDQLKAQDGYINYYNGLGWVGTLLTIEPGMGLMYKSSSSESFTFTYPIGSKGETLAKNITAENNHWVPDIHAYPNNMTVTAIVELDDIELGSDIYELAAFANGECRGSVRLMYIEPINRYVAFLTIMGEINETLNFSLYDTQTGEEIHGAQESIDFINNATVGSVREPYIIRFGGIAGADEFGSRIHVFPNPVERGKQISLGMTTEEVGEMQIEIINALGVVETLYATSVQTPVMLTAPATAGVYMLRITVKGKGTVIRKLMVR